MSKMVLGRRLHWSQRIAWPISDALYWVSERFCSGGGRVIGWSNALVERSDRDRP